MSDGTDTWQFSYNADGLRTKRESDSHTYTYRYDGDQLRTMSVDDVHMFFVYNADGPMAISYSGTTYYYTKNLQGDITGLVDSNGNSVVEYTYDAWGNILSITGSLASTLGAHNPLRYRSYIYDSETKLYYLQSRYYNPEIGRFLNADGLTTTGQGLLGNNMFAYCCNNPVSRKDPTGQFWGAIENFFSTLIAEIGNAFKATAGVYAASAGFAVADGPLPFGEAVGLAAVAVTTIGAIGYGVIQTVKSKPFSIAKTDAKAEAITKKADNPVLFPINPNDFNPLNLSKISRAGTKNGMIIQWVDTAGTEVFRWDENTNYPNGPHYHIRGQGHYYPGDIIPEPYATIYFPLS